MNRWKTLMAWAKCLIAGGRCQHEMAVVEKPCRLPKDHEGSHVYWGWYWTRRAWREWTNKCSAEPTAKLKSEKLELTMLRWRYGWKRFFLMRYWKLIYRTATA